MEVDIEYPMGEPGHAGPYRRHHRHLSGQPLRNAPGCPAPSCDRVLLDRGSKCLTPAPLALPLGILAASQPLDIITTYMLLSSGVAVEGNPLTAWLIALGGLGLVLAMKLGLTASIAGKACWLAKSKPAKARRYVLVVAGFYTAVVSWNAGLMLGRL